ncbi:hypothetical protein ABPS01_09890, partial [Streptococcus sp. ZJ151]
TLPDKDSEAPITADDVEEPLSPQDPSDGSEESSPSDDVLIDSESPLSPELPSTLPDKDSEHPITADDVEEFPYPQDSIDNSDDDSGEEFIPASYLLLDTVADSEAADRTDSRSEEEMEAIESPVLERETSKIMPVGIATSEDNSSQPQGRWFNVTRVPVTSTSSNLDVSVKIAQKVLERFNDSVYSSEERNATFFDQSELEPMTNDESQHLAEASKATVGDDGDIGLFDGTVDNFFSIKKKDDLGSLLVHLLMVVMIIAYSLVGFYFLRRDH